MSVDLPSPFTDAEIEHLALRVVANRVSWVDEWLEWEDYPEMGQYEFERLTEQVKKQAGLVVGWSRNLDWGKEIDSIELLERAGA